MNLLAICENHHSHNISRDATAILIMDIYMIAVVLAPYPPAPFPAGKNNFSSCGLCGKGENLFLRDWGA